MASRFQQALDFGLLPNVDPSNLVAIDPPDADACTAQTIVTRFATIAEAARMAGKTATADLPEAGIENALVTVGRARAGNRWRIGQAARALAPGGLLMVDGQKTDGVDALHKECRALTEVADSFSKNHGRLFWMTAEAAQAVTDWADLADTWPLADGFHTGPGVFSADGIDPGSAFLLTHLPTDLSGRGADLGAGWGYLSASVLASDRVTSLHLVENDHVAVRACHQNINDARAHIHWADVTTWTAPDPLDFVVMNPPFHAGRAVDLGLSRDFIAVAARSLTRKGELWLVANRHLPYEACLDQHFAKVEARAAGHGYKVLHAIAPRPIAGGSHP